MKTTTFRSIVVRHILWLTAFCSAAGFYNASGAEIPAFAATGFRSPISLSRPAPKLPNFVGPGYAQNQLIEYADSSEINADGKDLEKPGDPTPTSESTFIIPLPEAAAAVGLLLLALRSGSRHPTVFHLGK